MSHFFEDVGNVITAPFREIAGFVTGNPKYNSIEDIYNQTVGDSNPIADIAQNEGLNKFAKLASLPAYDELGKPGEAFANFIDKQNSVLPPAWRQYAQPVESALLNFVPGAGPALSAAYNTAYQGGDMQRTQKGLDWGALGKDAAINFGTAALQTGANALTDSAKSANSAKQAASTLHNFNVDLGTGSSALSSTANAAKASTQGALAAFNPTDAAMSLIGGGVGNAAGQSLNPAMSLKNGGVGTAEGSSLPLFKNAQAVAGSGIGDAAYKAGVNALPGLGNQALVSTLSPENSQPISGVLDSFSGANNGPTTNGLQWGDLLNAFGGGEINTPNPNGYRLDENAVNDMTIRLGANNFLQQNQARDAALPAGQYTPVQNTPYANRLSEINAGTDQSFHDLMDQVDNANKYYNIIDSNQGLTSDQLDTFLKDPSGGVLGNFSVPQDQLPYFQGIRPLGPLNMSLL